MDIIKQLSSQQGDRTSFSNKEVAAICIDNPHLLKEIAKHLDEDDQGIKNDTAEVMTVVAETDPQLIVPFVEKLIAQFFVSIKKARWECAHAIALIAELIPDQIEQHLDKFAEIICTDKSVIVRDFIFLAVSIYATSSNQAAESTLKIILKADEVWAERHAKQVLIGLQHIVKQLPKSHLIAKEISNKYSVAKKAVHQKEAKKLLKLID